MYEINALGGHSAQFARVLLVTLQPWDHIFTINLMPVSLIFSGILAACQLILSDHQCTCLFSAASITLMQSFCFIPKIKNGSKSREAVFDFKLLVHTLVDYLDNFDPAYSVILFEFYIFIQLHSHCCCPYGSKLPELICLFIHSS